MDARGKRLLHGYSSRFTGTVSVRSYKKYLHAQREKVMRAASDVPCWTISEIADKWRSCKMFRKASGCIPAGGRYSDGPEPQLLWI